RFGPFLVVEVANGVSLDYHDVDGDIASQHYAFLVSEDEFDAIYGKIVERGLDHWADPGLTRPKEITATTVAAGSTSPTPTATCSRSSLARTAAARSSRRHAGTIAPS